MLLCVFLLVGGMVYAQGFEGNWSGQLHVGGSSLRLVFHIGKNGYPSTMDSPDQGAKGFPVQVELAEGDSLRLKMPDIKASYIAHRQGDSLVGEYSQSGMHLPLVLSQKTIAIRRPQSPTPPYPYVTKEVKFTGGGASVQLAGTLSYPEGYKAGRGAKPPLVVMVTGSGLQDRDETLLSHKPFAVIADYLARHGIASLRYDDRGYGASTGLGMIATTQDFARDAEAAISFARSLGEFSSVGLLGHSEGAAIGFILGAKGIPDFVISMAGPGLDGKTIFLQQLYRQEQVPQGEQAEKMFKRAMEMKQMKSMWMRYFVTYDPKADIASTRCPVLLLQGEKDQQVYCRSNMEALRAALPKGEQNAERVYSGLNHLFQHCSTGAVTEYNQIEETISPEVLQDIATWVRGLGFGRP